MKVFKFGGASVKDADGIRNVVKILKMYPQQQIVVVVSAMGKTTNALEKMVKSTTQKEADELCKELENYHNEIVNATFEGERKDEVLSTIRKLFDEIKDILKQNHPKGIDEHYDKVVSYGEKLSVQIVCPYLLANGIQAIWQDACESIRTDTNFKEAGVNFTLTQSQIKENYSRAFQNSQVIVTEGFIGQSESGKTTTLGREGSDYTAAIIAYCLNAESVTIWKDVQGVLNADPKWFDNTVKIDHLSYQDALELAYYGATVIHPKTIKPLQNRNIPLYVKSFLMPAEAGTRIDNNFSQLPVPCFIFKMNQVLLSISPKDFSFIVEENLSRIFKKLAKYKLKVNVIQNSALNFSLCLDDDTDKIPPLLADLREDFRVLYNKDLELITIRYYNQATIDRVCIDKKALLEHKSRYTVQLVVQQKNKDKLPVQVQQ